MLNLRAFHLPARPTLLLAAALGLPGLRADDAAAVQAAAAGLKQALTQNWDTCELPERMTMPAAGHWKGFYRLTVEMRHPPVVMTMKTEGTLEFDLARPDLQDPPRPPPPGDLLRRPLGKAGPKPGSTDPNATSVSQEELAKAWDRLNGKLPGDTEVSAEADALARKIAAASEGNYQGLYVGPNENAKVQGTATYNRTDNASFAVSGASLNEPMGTKAPVELEVRAEEDPGTGQFKEIDLRGTPNQIPYGANLNLQTPDSYVHGQINLQGNSVNAHVVAVDAVGQRTEQSATMAADLPSQKMTLVGLKVLEQECWLLKGTVDASRMIQAMQQGGMQAVVTDTEWIATLDERDVDFEQRVKALAAEPIPSPLTWDYVDRFNQQWQSLRGSGKLSDYRLCVLKDLDRKAVKITVAGLRELLHDFPKVRDMNNACAAITVINAALERILPLIRRLQLEGIDCPLAASWTDIVDNEMHELVKNTLARKHTVQELDCLAGFGPFRYGAVDYGDQDQALADTWTASLQARINAAGGLPSN